MAPPPPAPSSTKPSSFTARKMSNAGQGPLPTLTIPPSIPHNEPAGDVPLKQHAAPREAAAPSHHATASPLPVGAPGVTPPLSTASASRPLGRSGTLKGQQQQQQQQGSTQKPRESNIAEDQGYEGGVERHGQANDFKDDDSDEQASSSSAANAGGNQARRPKLASHGSSGEVKARDHATPGAGSVKPQAAARNSPSAHEGIRNSLPSDLPDADSFARSMQRNRNPSASAYAHPGKLPYGRGKQQGGGPPKARSPSMTSQRSVEATSHPFPTPGLKKQDGFQFDQWKSLEEQRLDEDERKEKHWKRWGPYVSERQWATVREDYSANGDAWTHFPHEHARSRAYRWGEDGLAGISDNHGRLCLSVALWNGVDPILKERMFGTTGHQGNHGEDVKELYWYLDSTPTHSYMKMLYKYPQRPYPYEQLVRESTNRGRDVEEYEITDTDAFEDNRYWDVFVEYAKDEDCAEGVSIRITAYNRGPEPATLHIVPQLWFRNTWSWPKERPTGPAMPSLRQVGEGVVQADHEKLGKYFFHANSSPAPIGPRGKKEQHETVFVDDVVTPELLFTDNDTNFERLYGGKNAVPYVKDAFHDHIIPSHRPPMPKADAEATDGDAKPANGDGYDSDSTQDGRSTPRPDDDTRQFVNPNKEGTKCGAHYVFRDVPGNGGCAVVRLKLTTRTADEDPAILDEENFDGVVEDRRMDSDEFYSRFNSGALSDDLRNVMRQALSGMLWTKQFYMFIQKEWIEGDPGQPPPPPERKNIRNKEWKHMHIEDILSMPDKWEYPFFAIWDSAFHCIPLAMIDPAYAKKQLDIMTREWYMKPDGALPAYEWNFGDVNPPVHAWATFRVFKIERKMHGREDIAFLERVFQKLLINFTWWVNRKDASGENVFEGGFLGLDNISPFNRSEQLPTGGTMRQADGTGWMGFYALTMLNIALELAKHNSVYEDIASKFFEHFLFISDAMTFHNGEQGEVSLWNDETGFYFDAITWGPDSSPQQIPVRSLVGLIPMYATLTLEPSTIKRFPGFKKRMDWFLENRTSISRRNIANMSAGGKGDRRLLALANEDRLRRILERMLDENEFLSEYGIRSLSRYHKEHPWSWNVNGEEFSVHFWPGDSHSGMFGGNSNWRGPIWLATTFLLIESLQRFYQYYGNDFKIECPTGSGDMHTLAQVAEDIQHRVIHLFARDHEGNRACNGGSEMLNKDPHFRDYVPFHEFFNCENGKGLGASHQTGWTGLVAYFIWSVGSTARLPRTPRTPRSVAAHYFDEVATPGASEAETSAWDSDYSAAELDIDEL